MNDSVSESPGKAAALTRPEGKKKRKPLQLEGYLLVAPAVLLFATFILLPLLNTVVYSFFKYSVTGASRTYIGVSNYVELFSDPIFWLSLKNNIIILVGSVLFQVGGGLILAAILQRGITTGKAFFRTAVFAPVVMSTVAVGILWQLIFKPTNGLLTNIFVLLSLPVPTQGWLGDKDIVMYAILLVACWQYIGYMTVILLAGMQSIPEEFYEAAKLDGANEVHSFRHITVPLTRNVIIAGMLLTMIGAFKVFDLVYVLTRGGPANASQVLGTYVYYNAFTVGRAGYANAIAVVLLIFAIALGVSQLRLTRSYRR